MRKLLPFLILAIVLPAACSKNNVSKIPHIALTAIFPTDSILVNQDTLFMQFNIVDGDGDIGHDNQNDTTSAIYIKDLRFDTSRFTYIRFPSVDPTVEDPKKGLTGTCVFYPVPQPVPRDSLHSKVGDTVSYEFYITDRAGHQSNHVTTPKVRIHL